jgi:hypothetical protein
MGFLYMEALGRGNLGFQSEEFHIYFIATELIPWENLWTQYGYLTFQVVGGKIFSCLDLPKC